MKTTKTNHTKNKRSQKSMDKKNIVIATLAVAVGAMAVGYAAFATTLNINGTATIAGEWDVEITDITFSGTGQAKDGSGTTYTATTATFDCELYAPGDACEYTVTVENKGTVKAVLDSIALAPDTTNAEYIDMTVTEQPAANDALEAGDTHTVKIKSTYKDTIDGASAPAAGTARTLSGGTLIYKQAAS